MGIAGGLGSDDRLLSHVTCPSWQKMEM